MKNVCFGGTAGAEEIRGRAAGASGQEKQKEMAEGAPPAKQKNQPDEAVASPRPAGYLLLRSHKPLLLG